MALIRSLSVFILQSVTAGLALAFLILYFWPELRPTSSNETPEEIAARAGAVSSYSDAVDRAAPSVVSIYTERVEYQQISPQLQRIFGNAYVARARLDMGSGVLVAEDGYILTNHHVIDGADEIIVRMADRHEFEAKLIKYSAFL